MAAKRGRTSRKRKRKEKTQRARPLLKWRRPTCQRNRWKPPMRRLNRWVKTGSCQRSISRLLRQLPPRRMSAKAKRLMDASMGVLCKGLVNEADRRRRRRRGSFIGTVELRAAVEAVMRRGARFVFPVTA